MTPRPPEVADVFRRYGDSYREQHGASLSTAQRRAMSAIEICRTAALGGHVEQCDSCSHQRISYNSCRSRNCPKCQSLARAQWVEDRQAELLDTEYFHVVFTVPDEIAVIAYQNKAQVYDILFHAAAETLRTRSRSIRSTWAPRSAFSPSFIRGGRTCLITPTCTASFLAADRSSHVRSEMLLKRDPADPAPAEEAFLTAIVVARQQGTRSFELRAVLSLANLYQSTARAVEAHAILAPALEGFSPTPEMPEIAEAISLFERLA